MDFFAILISILMIAVLIIVHEFGHFLAARYFGFQTPVFGLGLPFGPGINLFKKWGTQFKLYFAFIGGFVAIPELGDETNKEELEKYDVKFPLKEFPVYQRAIVAVAGIVFNIIFAFLIAAVMAGTVGLPNAKPNNSIAAYSSETSMAKQIGIQLGDKVIEVDGQSIKTASDLQDSIKNSSGKQVTIVLSRPIRDEEGKVESYKTVTKVFDSQGSLGVVLGYDKVYQKSGSNPLSWIIDAFLFTAKTFFAMVLSVFALFAALFNKIIGVFVPAVEPSSVDLGQVKGIVGIIQLISEDLSSNLILLFDFAILLNLNLAVINLLPIPALDGGHLLFMAYEAVAGEKPSEKIQGAAMQAGFLFLISIILITTFNDIRNWAFG